jgi:hypothetical protein
MFFVVPFDYVVRLGTVHHLNPGGVRVYLYDVPQPSVPCQVYENPTVVPRQDVPHSLQTGLVLFHVITFSNPLMLAKSSGVQPSISSSSVNR